MTLMFLAESRVDTSANASTSSFSVFRFEDRA
jgi:hypothetical protein